MVALRIKLEVEQELINILFSRRLGLEMLRARVCVCVDS